eukprot:Seg794.1 transcript_id=Seg794.1/GoldUCD/mRNA.D3Y31 product="hypothetical protein" protein_id=Seg794.1/GoldUCD/D3Y31
MLTHNWELFAMLAGKPIAVCSESVLEAWNKHIRNFRSGAGCRAHQTSCSENVHDIFVRMLITSSPTIAQARWNSFKRNALKCEVPYVPSKEEALVQDLYEE